MLKKELLERTPMRILDQSTHGGLQPGEVGLFVGPKGSGKTACMVHIATIRLLEGKHVVHLTFSDSTSHLVSWYETIFDEVAARHNLEGAREVHDETVKNRIIVNFRQNENAVAQLESSLQLIEDSARFHADRLIVDGFDFANEKVENLQELRRFAKDHGFCIWMCASLELASGENAVPEALQPFMDEVAIMIGLERMNDHVRLRLVKDHDEQVQDMHLALDPKTLLITEETTDPVGA